MSSSKYKYQIIDVVLVKLTFKLNFVQIFKSYTKDYTKNSDVHVKSRKILPLDAGKMKNTGIFWRSILIDGS